jgi:hypothetical protein
MAVITNNKRIASLSEEEIEYYFTQSKRLHDDAKLGVRLHFLEGRTVVDVAKQIGRSYQATYNVMARVENFFLARLEKH